MLPHLAQPARTEGGAPQQRAYGKRAYGKRVYGNRAYGNRPGRRAASPGLLGGVVTVMKPMVFA